MKQIKTGIAGFDEFLLGGLPPRVILLLGQPGSGNEVFARQIAYTRAKQTKITYFTINRTPEFVKEEMLTYGWDITPLEKTGNWKFINLTTTAKITETVINEIKQHRTAIIDSLSELLIKQKTEEAINLLVTMATTNRQTEECHLILLTEGMQDKQTETAMEHFAEGVIILNTTWAAETTNRTIIIKKMAGTLVPTRRLPYSIGKKGFIIETAIRIT
ncbi:MAG: RAD55 family ATPase [Candidatus Bathyarchaeia archaeon]